MIEPTTTQVVRAMMAFDEATKPGVVLSYVERFEGISAAVRAALNAHPGSGDNEMRDKTRE